MGREPPSDLVALLDGDDLQAKTEVSIGVMTVDPDGWPRPAHLSAGEVLLRPDGEVRLCLHAGSSATRNVQGTGRVVLTIVSGGADHELRCEVSPGPLIEDDRLATFTGRVVDVHEHRAPYADVTGGVRFELHDAEATLERWRRQIAALRKI